MQQCHDGKLLLGDDKSALEDDKSTLEDVKFTFDNDNALSPTSEIEKVLLIDESVDHSVQTLLSEDIITEGTKLVQEDEAYSKIELKKTCKQQCFTCGKVMSSRLY